MTDKHYFNLTWILWFIYTLTACVIISVYHDLPLASKLYYTAGEHWLAGKPIYEANNHFLYFPQTAIVYSYITHIPQWIYDLAWRFIAFGLISLGLYRVARMNDFGAQPKYFFIMSVVTMFLGFIAAITGALDLLVIAGMLLAAAEILDERWWWAAIYLVIGLSLDPKMILMLLLARTIYRSLFFRAMSLVLLGVIMPFFFQKITYVWAQYSLMHHVGAALNASEQQWPQFFSLLGHLHIFIPMSIQNISRFIVAVIVFIFCFHMKLRFGKPVFVILVYTVAALFLMLFNPRTEFADYIILAPALGYFITTALLQKRYYTFSFFIGITMLIFFSVVLSLLINPILVSWLPPMCAIGFSAYIGGLFYNQPKNSLQS